MDLHSCDENSTAPRCHRPIRTGYLRLFRERRIYGIESGGSEDSIAGAVESAAVASESGGGWNTPQLRVGAVPGRKGTLIVAQPAYASSPVQGSIQARVSPASPGKGSAGKSFSRALMIPAQIGSATSAAGRCRVRGVS